MQTPPSTTSISTLPSTRQRVQRKRRVLWKYVLGTQEGWCASKVHKTGATNGECINSRPTVVALAHEDIGCDDIQSAGLGGPDMVTSSFLQLRLTCHCFREVYMSEQLLLRGCTHIQICGMSLHHSGMLSPRYQGV